MRDEFNTDVCIIGLGPAGIGTALSFSKSNLASRVLCLDIGTSLNTKSCSILQNGNCKKENPCQMISGFGGCSLLSGGKLSAFPAGSKLGTILGSKHLAEKKLSEALSLFKSYLLLHKPRITKKDINNAKELFKKLGFEYKYYDVYLYDQEELRKAYQRMLLQLKSAGISIFLNAELIKIDFEKNGFKLIAKYGEQNIIIYTKYLVLG